MNNPERVSLSLQERGRRTLPAVFGLLRSRPLGFYLVLAKKGGWGSEDLAGKRILNAGAGIRDLGRSLKDQWGVDAEIVHLDRLYRFPPVRPIAPQESVAGDVRALPFGRQSFDLAFCVYLLSYYPETERRKMVSELAEVAKQIVVYPAYPMDKEIVKQLGLKIVAFEPVPFLRWAWPLLGKGSLAERLLLLVDAVIETPFPSRVLIFEGKDDNSVEHACF